MTTQSVRRRALPNRPRPRSERPDAGCQCHSAPDRRPGHQGRLLPGQARDDGRQPPGQHPRRPCEETTPDIDGGLDINGNGAVDLRAPGDTNYGFEEFRDKSRPRIGPALPGDGEFSQTIDATKLDKGLHFIEVRVFRHRTDGGPAIFTSLKKVISVQ